MDSLESIILFSVMHVDLNVACAFAACDNDTQIRKHTHIHKYTDKWMHIDIRLNYSYFQSIICGLPIPPSLHSMASWILNQSLLTFHTESERERNVNNSWKYAIIYWLIGFEFEWKIRSKFVRFVGRCINIFMKHSLSTTHTHIHQFGQLVTTRRVCVCLRAQTWIYLRRH